MKLTQKQSDLLQNIEAFISDNGYSPTFKELSEIEGVTFTATVNRLNSLKSRGLVTWEHHSPRTLKLNKIEALRARGE